MISTKKLISSGILAGPFFISMFLFEEMLRTGYSPIRDPVSSLSIGPYGWVQMATFWITGILFLLFAYGVRSKIQKSSRKSFWGPLLLGLAGIGLIGAGCFTTDPLPGYPQDLPYQLLPHTVHGQLHNFFSSFVFYGLPAACFVFTRYFLKTGKRPLAIYSLLSGIGALVVFNFVAVSIISITNDQETSGLIQIGLLQRLTLIIIFQWVTFLAVYMLKAVPSPRKSS
jgi:hypothetical protein